MDNSCRSLQAAVKDLYREFGDYHLDSRIQESYIWPERRQLLSRPLVGFTRTDLPDWVWKAGDEWGSGEEFKYFLPRVLDLLASGGLEYWPEATLERLTKAAWLDWPASEQDAVRCYLMTLWRCTLARCHVLDAGSLLCGIAIAQEDLEPYLTVWRDTRSGTALRHLSGFISGHFSQLRKKRRLAGYWQRSPSQAERVLEWLLDAATAGMLEEGFFRYQDQPFAHDLSIAHDQVDWLRRTWQFPRDMVNRD